MLVVPHAFQRKPIKHLAIASGVSTLASNSLAAPGTGLVFIPIYGWVSGSATASLTYYNGTGGSALFTLRNSANGVSEIFFYETPDNLVANKAAVIETNTGIGNHEFHVWCIVVRGGAGQDALGQ